MFNGTNLTLSSDVDQDTYENVTKTQENTTHKRAKRSAISQAARNRKDSIAKTNTKHNPQTKHRLETVSKNHMFNGIDSAVFKSCIIQPTKSDSDVIFQLLSKTLTCTPHVS